MQYIIDYSKTFILSTFINIFVLFFINTNYSTLFIYLNSISLNLIMFYDIYFQMKNKYINFEIIPKFYPSSRTYLNKIWELNIISIIFGVSYICYDFWTTQFIDFIFLNKSNDYIFCTIIITCISTLFSLVFLVGIIYYSTIIMANILEISKLIMFNYINEKPLFSNLYNEAEYICWICNKGISKYKIVKKLNCPCQEHFHPDCIDKYLVLYKNYCRAGHKIAKYEHTV
jgi:hypothetical protein